MISRKDIDCGKEFDWGLTSENYAKYRDIYPAEFYKSIIQLGCGTKGQRMLDLATGTGVLPRGMEKYGAKWTGADISENQIKYARLLSEASGADIDYIASPAEELDFEAESFDGVTAAQCFMYFKQAVLLPKIHKWLKPGGHFLITIMDWLPFESEIAMKSEKLILKYNPAWSGCGRKRSTPSVPKCAEGLFDAKNIIAYATDIPFTSESWNGRIKACRGIEASLTSAEIEKWEAEHKKMLAEYPESFKIPHFITIMDLVKI